ncbi:hypothetical protein NBRC10512_004349 [Rhodotorula toruloides]|uniref:RHTO0S17e00298g1_1 n=2 Tax=Rhodotorula toruloides TaxID=5286 RepID=A0A061BMG7_RHOTO|nr:uncharacterized protein RHTO_03310 [Rhodotorula toruloides NP11]EMS20391.1 hypothetical protein RHTO_03310 [Rhodotorula toruloides NP11]CDR48280.1 RHTO0S17e00298g1_1 [Rhodotorula toruloides]
MTSHLRQRSRGGNDEETLAKWTAPLARWQGRAQKGAGGVEYVPLAAKEDEDGLPEDASPSETNDLLPTSPSPSLSRPTRMALLAALLVAITAAIAIYHAPREPFRQFYRLRHPNPPPTRVGSRHFGPFYHGKGCNSTQLVASLARSRIRPDGASRTVYAHPEGLDPNDIHLDTFDFSFDLDGCPPPHTFSPRETCDLVSAFGGIYNRGDSLMRQFAQGLFMLLANSLDLVYAHKDGCQGTRIFTNGTFCKDHSILTSLDFAHVCPEQPFVMYDLVWRFTHERRDGENEPDYATPLLDSWHRFIDQLPPDRRRYSPIFVEATGIHYQWDFNATLAVHISPFIRNTSALIPRPIPFFSGYPAVPPNKPVQWLGIQGPEVTQKYNREMLAALEEVSPEGSIDGGWTMLQWYNVTDGAVSYDGTHYDYQVALERAQIFLNVLDAIWGEVVESGGLVVVD